MKYDMWTFDIARGFIIRHRMLLDSDMTLPIWQKFETAPKPIPRPYGWAIARGVIVSSMEKMAARYRECMVSFCPNIMKRISIILVTVLYVKRWMLNEIPHASSRYSAGLYDATWHVRQLYDATNLLKLWDSPNAHTSRFVRSMEKMAARYREGIVPFQPNIIKSISIILVTVWYFKRWTLNEIPHVNCRYSAGIYNATSHVVRQ